MNETATYDGIAELEKWHGESKQYSVSIGIDDGFGASCWEVILHRGKRTVTCSAMVFVRYSGVDPRWIEKDGDLFVSPGCEDNEWPGLNETIRVAIESARKFWKRLDQ
jgi:hypothetical protein